MESEIIIIFGAGIYGKNVRMRLNDENVFCDNNIKVQGSFWEKTKILSVEQAVKMKNAIFIIPTSSYASIMEEQLLNNNVDGEKIY